jgi:DNA-binding PadR family transcriptional regulator
MFANFLGCLESACSLKGDATIGNIQKMNPHMTRGQVERALNNLASEGYVFFETVAYGRTGKKVWHATENGIINLCAVTRAYAENE